MYRIGSIYLLSNILVHTLDNVQDSSAKRVSGEGLTGAKSTVSESQFTQYVNLEIIVVVVRVAFEANLARFDVLA